LYEDMCFDCQQSVEKALKALMLFKNIEFEYTHNIGLLIKTLEDNDIEVPDNIKRDRLHFRYMRLKQGIPERKNRLPQKNSRKPSVWLRLYSSGWKISLK
jgi:HEPN domain-containing protein